MAELMAATMTVLVFLKYPRPGEVKTRLAARIGPQHAAELYRGWIDATLNMLAPLRNCLDVVGYFTGASESAFAPWAHLVDEWLPQPAGELGERLRSGFQHAHQTGRPVLAIGTDCLDLDAALIESAFETLHHHDVVLGPASDGGYYLIGSRAFVPALFDAVRWSSPFTLVDQLDACRREGCTWAMLPPRNDIDTFEDWQHHCERKPTKAPNARGR